MPALAERSEPELFRDLLLRGLRVKDETLNAVAAECLVRQGNRPAGQLVLEALREKNPPGYRVRVLGVLERIAAGPGLDIMDVVDLNALLFAKNKTVREATFRFFGRAGSGSTLNASTHPQPARKRPPAERGDAPSRPRRPAG